MVSRIFPFFFRLAMVTNNDMILYLKQGQIRGGNMVSRNGREFKAFQGIPYAKPPIDDLRFKVNNILSTTDFK